MGMMSTFVSAKIMFAFVHINLVWISTYQHHMISTVRERNAWKYKAAGFFRCLF